MLDKNDFGEEVEQDNDPIFANTVSDSYKILRDIIEAGKKENTHLFKNTVLISVTDSAFIQATAETMDEYDVVLITEGFINVIRKSICKLFSQTNTFKNIDILSQENNSVQPFSDGNMLPKCDERREFINGTIQRALEYVFIHELAHLFYGHRDYMKKMYKLHYQYPFRMIQSKDRNFSKKERHNMEIKADRHAMEIQADRYAADVTLMFALKEIWHSNNT